ncbi:hypothetical protein Zmor_017530 [Zophobas morio]|uniref:Uncharacterized protein n=1 Tax=Zophobas morio TaxID=2755281 RepID=A0AA38I8L0_9CUCU|nr:hypothetical protein Zmor_017530 [Zophobas morio]
MSKTMKEQAEEARKKLVPNKSADRYQKEYEIFKNWQQTNNVTEVDEDVILADVSEFSKKYEGSSVWTKISMVKSMLLTNENLDISSLCISQIIHETK